MYEETRHVLAWFNKHTSTNLEGNSDDYLCGKAAVTSPIGRNLISVLVFNNALGRNLISVLGLTNPLGRRLISTLVLASHLKCHMILFILLCLAVHFFNSPRLFFAYHLFL